MRFIHRGWVRLWVVVSLVIVPAMAFWQFDQWSAEWQRIDDWTIRNCVDAEFGRANHPDALKCGHSAGADKTVFQRENTTPLVWWSQALFFALLFDLITTATLVLIYVAIRWVWRGFRPSSKGQSVKSE